MKTLKLILLAIAFGVAIYYTEAKAQLQFDYLPGGGIPIDMNSEVDACFFFNFDGDPFGSNELKIVHGDDVGCYITSNTSIPIYARTHAVNSIDLWSDCDHRNFFNWHSDTAWISKDGTRLTDGSHVLPFKYGDKIGYFVLRLIPGSDTLRVRGYKFMINPRDFECYQLYAPSRSSLEEKVNFKDYNYLGEPIDEYYTGFAIRVYESGESIKIMK